MTDEGAPGPHAAAYGLTADELAAMTADRTRRARSTTLDEPAEAAPFPAADRAAAITRTVANRTGGLIVD